MIISLSEFKANVGRYVDLAEMEDVVITKYGKPAAKIVRIDKKTGAQKKFPSILDLLNSSLARCP